MTFDYQMEFVDNKKTACFCGSAKCSGLIGEKPKEPRKILVPKRRIKRKAAVKILPPMSKKQRVHEDTKDPLEEMLQGMPAKVVTRQILAKALSHAQNKTSVVGDTETNPLDTHAPVLELEAAEDETNDESEQNDTLANSFYSCEQTKEPQSQTSIVSDTEANPQDIDEPELELEAAVDEANNNDMSEQKETLADPLDSCEPTKESE